MAATTTIPGFTDANQPSIRLEEALFLGFTAIHIRIT
jgi:hypothetical protein